MTHPRTADHPDDITAVVEDRLPDRSLTPAGRRTAAQLLAARGATPDQIADLLGVTTRTVYRWHAATRTPA